MNDSEQYFSDLQNLATAQDKAKFRSLALTFHSTLQRLPALKQELEVMLQSTEFLDYIELLKRVEPILQQVNNWLWDVDNLPNDLANDEEMKKFTADICVKLGLTNVNRLIPNFYDFQRVLINKNNERQRIINQKQQQEALIIAEKERQKKLEEELQPFKQLMKWAHDNTVYINEYVSYSGGTLLEELMPWQLRSLDELAIDHNLKNLSDDIDKLINLIYLQISDTQLTKFPESISNLTQLKTLSITYNQLTRLPESIGNLTQLIELNILRNKLTRLPDSISNLTQLQKLCVSNNQLSNLPESIGNLTKLEVLNVNDNQLTNLPKAIGNLTQLRALYVNNNQLTSLPESIGNLTQLIVLDISGNRLTDLPECISHFNSINAENNPLSFWQRLKWSKNENIKI